MAISSFWTTKNGWVTKTFVKNQKVTRLWGEGEEITSKRGDRGSSSSSVSSNTELNKARMNEEEEETNSLRDLIQNLTANMESNFAKLHEELCGLRQEMKEEIDMLKSNI